MGVTTHDIFGDANTAQPATPVRRAGRRHPRSARIRGRGASLRRHERHVLLPEPDVARSVHDLGLDVDLLSIEQRGAVKVV